MTLIPVLATPVADILGGCTQAGEMRGEGGDDPWL